MKITEEKVGVLVYFDEDELEALVTLMGNMSTKDDMEFGLSHDQAELMYLIYCELSDYVDNK